MFEAASTALNTKLLVVSPLTADAVPVILNFDTPSSCTVEDDIPAGIEPDCNSKETLPADSGSLATIVNVADPPSITPPKEPAAVTYTGD